MIQYTSAARHPIAMTTAIENPTRGRRAKRGADEEQRDVEDRLVRQRPHLPNGAEADVDRVTEDGRLQHEQVRRADDGEHARLRIEDVDPRTERDRDQDGRVVRGRYSPDPAQGVGPRRARVTAPHHRQEQHEPAQHEEQVDTEVRTADEPADRPAVENRRARLDPAVEHEHHERGDRAQPVDASNAGAGVGGPGPRRRGRHVRPSSNVTKPSPVFLASSTSSSAGRSRWPVSKTSTPRPNAAYPSATTTGS